MSGGDRIIEANAVRRRAQQNTDSRVRQEVTDYVESQRGQNSEQISSVNEADRLESAGERGRIGGKFRLADIIEEHYDLTMGDPELKALFDEALKYTAQNVTSVSKKGEYTEERETVKRLRAMVELNFQRLMAQAGDPEHSNISHTLRLETVMGLRSELEHMTMGDLNVGSETTASDRPPVFINYSQTNKVITKTEKDEQKHVKFNAANDEPLFPHEPCANDVSQGYLGDCYFVASLSGIADKYPEKIRNMMHDNEDGTVTVKFYQMVPGRDGVDKYVPLFVTVDKTVPTDVHSGDDRYAAHSLWVQVFERAYAASGLRMDANDVQLTKTAEDHEKDNLLHSERNSEIIEMEADHPWGVRYVRPVPPNINEIYDQIKAGLIKKPSHKECPWLVDAKDELHAWEPNYFDINGGNSIDVIRDVFGPEYDCKRYKFAKEGGFFLEQRGGINFRKMLDYTREKLAETDEAYSLANYNKVRKTAKGADFDSEILTSFLFGEKIAVHMTAGDDVTPEQMQKGMMTMMVVNAINAEFQNAFKQINITGDKDRDLQNMRTLFTNAATERKAFLQAKNFDTMLTAAGLIDKKDKLAAGIDRYAQLCSNYIEQNIDRILYEKEKWRKTVPYSGDYNGNANFIYNKIDELTRSDSVVFAGTPNTKENKVTPGILGPHEYTVLNVLTKNVNGKELKFVRLRNPHGQNVVEYTPTADGTSLVPKAAEAKASEGYFDIELNDFIYSFTDIDFTRANDYSRRREADAQNTRTRQAAMAGAVNEAQAQQMIDENKARGAYDKILEDISRNLEATHGKFTHDSQEFKDLEEAVKATRRTLMDGSRDANVNIARDFSVLMMKSQDYLNYCKSNPKSDSRRAQRVAIGESILKVAWMRQQGELHPKEKIQNELVDKVFDSLQSAVQGNRALSALAERISDPPVRAIAAKNYLRSPEFRNSIGTDYVTMMVAAKMSPAELGKFAKKTMNPSVTEAPKPRLNEKSHTATRSGLF